MSRPFFPGVSKNYVYLESLASSSMQDARELYTLACDAVGSINKGFSSGGADFEAAFINLQTLVIQERKAENNFLASNLGVDLQEVEQYGIKKMVESFNQILSFESTYKANVERVKAIEKKIVKSGTVDALYGLLNATLPNALYSKINGILGNSPERFEALANGVYDDLIMEEASRVVVESIKTVYIKNEKNSEVYREMAQLMERILSTPELRDDLIGKILQNYGATPDQLRKNLKKQEELIRKGGKEADKARGRLKHNNLTLSHQGGNAFEVMVDQILNGIGSSNGRQVIATGKLNNMKADHMIIVGLNNIEQVLNDIFDDQEVSEKSVRVRNIEGMSRLFEKLGDVAGKIIFISDKNYKLDNFSQGPSGSNIWKAFGGFAAEKAPSFATLGKVLTKANVDGINDLVFLLANSGEGRINKDLSGIEKYLATQIGNFLFDDIVITQQLSQNNSSIDRIHVFNLDNIYVPLSVFLEATLNALRDISSDYTQFVSVKVTPASVSYITDNELDSGDWSSFFNASLNSGKVSFKFFKSFIDFVSQNL